VDNVVGDNVVGDNVVGDDDCEAGIILKFDTVGNRVGGGVLV